MWLAVVRFSRQALLDSRATAPMEWPREITLITFCVFAEPLVHFFLSGLAPEF